MDEKAHYCQSVSIIPSDLQRQWNLYKNLNDIFYRSGNNLKLHMES